MKTTDVELINRTLNGDDTAFTELVEKYQKQVHALIWRKIGDFHIAEDITQDTFLKAYQGLAALKKSQSFASWLYVIAANNCSTWLRKKRVWTQPLEDTSNSQFGKATYSQYVIEENERTAVEAQREVVKKLLAKLPESERTIITLRYFSEMSSAEIGAFLGVSANTIRSRLRRAQQRLQKEETMIREALEHFQISPNLTDDIMREIARLKPAPAGSKPLVPWAIAASSIVLIVLMLGIGNQRLAHFQKPYSLDAQAEMAVELVDAPVVLNLEVKPDIRNQLGSPNVFGKTNNSGEKPDEVLLAAAAENSEDVSVPKQQWVQSAPTKGTNVGELLATSDGDLFTFIYGHIYKFASNGEEWQHISNTESLGNYYSRFGVMKEWNNTLYLILKTDLFASKDDGKTWDLVHSFAVDEYLALFDFVLTQQGFYVIFGDFTVFRSEDTGKTWKVVNREFPERPHTLFAVQDTMFAGTDNGLHRMKDGNWQRVEFPVSVGEIRSIAAAEGKLYVAAEFSRDVVDSHKVAQGLERGWWVFRSTDIGDSWDDITPTNAWPVKGWPPSIKLIATGETLLVMEKGMVRSIDSGDTWMPPQLPGTSPPMNDNSSAAVIKPGTIYVGSYNGLHRSTDGGMSWDRIDIGKQEEFLNNLIIYKRNNKGDNKFSAVYATFAFELVKTTDEGKTWKTIQMGTPMTAPLREEPPQIFRILQFGDIVYAKGGQPQNPYTKDMIPYSRLKRLLYRISADGNTLVPIQGTPIFDSQTLRSLWSKRLNGTLDLSDELFVEQLKENCLGATQFFKQLAQSDPENPVNRKDLRGNELIQSQDRLMWRGLDGAFAVSGDTFYVEYNFKLFRWQPGETEWSDTGVEETSELTYVEAKKAFEREGLPKEKIDEILRTWTGGFKLAVSGDTIYVGKRDGQFVASFDRGNNWLDLTPALPFPAKAFKDIVFAGSTVYVATDVGVAASENGKNWYTVTDASGTPVDMEKLTVDKNTLYGFSKNRGIYRLESGTWKQIISEVPEHVLSLAVDGRTLYVGTYSNGMLHFNLEE